MNELKLLVPISAILSVVLGVLSTLFVIKGTAQVPPDRWSWNGQSEWELAFRRTTRRWMIAGFWMLASAVVMSAVSSIAGYFS
jgi:hypothetical protein